MPRGEMASERGYLYGRDWMYQKIYNTNEFLRPLEMNERM